MDSPTPTPPPVRFLFDYVSPYAYLTWRALLPIAERHGRAVEPVPVLYSALLKAFGMRESTEIPSWRVYTFKDVIRTAKALGVVMYPPPRDPVESLLALRVSSLPLEPGARARLVEELLTAAWAGGRDISKPEELIAAANAVGLDGAALVQAARQPDAKARLRAQTDAAIAAGVWGVPMMLVEDEPFWKIDSLPHLERFLAGKDPINPARVAHWTRVHGIPYGKK